MTKVKLGDWLASAWKLLTDQWQTWCLISVVYFVPVGLVYGIAQVISFRAGFHVDYSNPWRAFFHSFGQSMTISLLMTVAITVIGAFFVGGIYRTAFKQMAGEPIRVSDIFSGVHLFPRILVVSAISGILQFMAAFLCYFPMFIVQGFFFLALPIVVRTDKDPLQALSDSYTATKGEWLMFAVLAFVANILSGLGVLACLVGLLFSFPLVFLISAVAYMDILETVTTETPQAVKVCRSCGRHIPAHANFCDTCGAGQVAS